MNLNDNYRPVLMWFWNARPEENEIRRQIAEFYQQGIREFFVHAAYGLEIEYLSEDYFQMIGVALDEARKRGMRFWIYDEYGWPSGTAGGSILREYPEDRMMLLLYARYDVLPGASVDPLLIGESVATYVLYKNLTQNSIERIDRLNQDVAHWENRHNSDATLILFRQMPSGGIHPSAKWSAFATEQEGSLDGCSPEAVRHFIQATHERYYAHFPDDFGKTIAGAFIDEPVLSTGWVLDLPKPFVGLPWHKDLFSSFQKRMGYDLLNHLYELALPVGHWRRTRCDYWKYLSGRFSQAFTCQMARWCSDHGIQLTGHINTEEILVLTLLCSGDLFPVLEAFHIPGADSICSKSNLIQDESIIAPKLVSSLAHQLGRSRILCETYTGSGWDLNFQDMKKVFDRLAVLGINCLQLMGAYYSIKGFRKLTPDASWPPSHSYQNTLWRHYHHFIDYAARVCHLNSQGKHMARVAVLYPITSAWVAYQFGHDDLLEKDSHYRLCWEIIQQTFVGLSKALLEIQCEFDFLFEDIFQSARIDADGVHIEGEIYSILCLPCCSTLRTETLHKIEQFNEAGGQLIFINSVPAYLDDGSKIPAEWGVDAEEINQRAFTLINDAQKTTEIIRSAIPAIHVVLTNCLDSESRRPFGEQLQTIIEDRDTCIRIQPYHSEIWIQRRQIQNTLQFCILNTGSQTYQGVVYLPDGMQVKSLNPEQSSWKTIQSFSRCDQYLIVPLSLEANELFYLRVDQECSSPITASDHLSMIGKEIILDPQWEMKPMGGNFFRLPLSAWCDQLLEPFSIDQIRILDEPEFTACPDYRFMAGMKPILGEGTGWGHMQGKHPLTGFHPGKSYWLRAEFVIKDLPTQISIITEELNLSWIIINGQPIFEWHPCCLWDESNLRVSIEPHIRAGTNTLLIRCRIPSWNAPHALPFVTLWGDFEVTPDGEIISSELIHNIGDWGTQGYPHFSGTMIYRQEFDLPARVQYDKALLCLDAAAEVVEANMNQMDLGVRLWPPYYFNASGILRHCSNTLQLKITNTSSNLFCQSVPSGILSRVRIFYDQNDIQNLNQNKDT